MGSVEEAGNTQRKMGWEAWTRWDGGDAGICVGAAASCAQGQCRGTGWPGPWERRGHPGPGFAWEKETRVTMGALGLWPLEAAPTHLNMQ